ncbi:MAG: GGDEF domain-containing protein [Bacillota bacterium]
MKYFSQWKLLLSMIGIGIISSQIYHYAFMNGFLNLFIHCIAMGIFFGLINFFVVKRFYVGYISLKENNKDLKNQAYLDKLTGLLNRRKFDEDARKITTEDNYAVIFIDIDNFRDFNNKYAHRIGDQVLIKVAQLIKNSLRPQDCVYRYGGEEIVILLKGCNKESAYMIGERVRKDISNLDNSPYPQITVSLGISSYPEDGNNVQDILTKSDEALLSAKRLGKNRCKLCS